jgi:hypothetical protein
MNLRFSLKGYHIKKEKTSLAIWPFRGFRETLGFWFSRAVLNAGYSLT